MSLVNFGDKIIKNIFKNLEIELDRNGFLKRREELDLKILLELITKEIVFGAGLKQPLKSKYPT